MKHAQRSSETSANLPSIHIPTLTSIYSYHDTTPELTVILLDRIHLYLTSRVKEIISQGVILDFALSLNPTSPHFF